MKFDRGRATLRSVWLAVAYRASLGDDRECFASLTTLSKQALVSVRTVRYHLVTLAALGLIHTDNRTGGHAPTKWSISEVSPSVLGGKDCRGGRQRLPGGAAKVAAEVSNRSYAPTGHELLASKQQPDGACAPPAAATKNIAATTKNTQPQTEGPEPTRTPEPTQTLAPAKTDTGGVTRGGASDKQIAYLQVLADKVGAEPAEDLWRAADPKRLQVQIKAAKAVRERGGKHTHAADVEEAIFRVGVMDQTGYKEGVERCECGAARSVVIKLDRTADDHLSAWTLSGYLVDYLVAFSDLYGPMTADELSGYNGPDDDPAESLVGRWRAPMTWEEVSHLYKTLPKSAGWDDEVRLVPVDWPIVAAEAEEKARVAAEAKKKAWTIMAAKAKEEAWTIRRAAEAEEKARVAAEAEEKVAAEAAAAAEDHIPERETWDEATGTWVAVT